VATHATKYIDTGLSGLDSWVQPTRFPGLQKLLPLFLWAVGGVEVDNADHHGMHHVGSCPNDSVYIGIVSMEKQSSGDKISCPGSMHT
jgi:hypothetical protein